LITGSIIGNDGGNYKCLIHLDRLSITFRHLSVSIFQNVRNLDYISNEQFYGDITLRYDSSKGIGAYYHTFQVYYKGYLVGRLHTGSKLKKPDLQFDFTKEVFYSFKHNYWYEVYQAIMNDLGIIYNNIGYIEISIDTDKNLVGQFGFYYQNTVNNKLRFSNQYKMRKNTDVHVMHNGASFLIAGSENEIAIYQKSKHAEEFILNYFSNNGFTGMEVNRIEARLNWNYIRYLRNKKGLDINVETLVNQRKLAKIFQISTTNKIAFLDTTMKTIDRNRNSHYQELSVIDDLPIETAEIGRLNPELKNHHYKDDKMIDENIIRQIYYRYLETGNKKYLRNFRSIAGIASIDERNLENLVTKFNERYKGNRNDAIIQRMDFASKRCSKKPTFQFNEMIYSLALKMKWNIMGMF
jgi:hypothetical protein